MFIVWVWRDPGKVLYTKAGIWECATNKDSKSGPSEAVRHGGGRRTKNLQGEREKRKRREEGKRKEEKEKREEKGKKGRGEQERKM